MTKLLERAFQKVQALPVELQDEAARLLLAFAGGDDEPEIELSPEERADLEEAQAETARGDFATEAQIQNVLAKYRL